MVTKLQEEDEPPEEEGGSVLVRDVIYKRSHSLAICYLMALVGVKVQTSTT